MILVLRAGESEFRVVLPTRNQKLMEGGVTEDDVIVLITGEYQ
jgi:hypothetical protein